VHPFLASSHRRPHEAGWPAAFREVPPYVHMASREAAPLTADYHIGTGEWPLTTAAIVDPLSAQMSSASYSCGGVCLFVSMAMSVPCQASDGSPNSA
jgi:hypothetical protein